MTKKQIIGCVLGGLIILSGMIGAVVYIIAAMIGTFGEGNRILVPGETVIDFEEPGDYTIYHEFTSSYDGKLFSQEPGQAISGLQVYVIDEDTGYALNLENTNFSSNYSINSRQGVSILKFTVENSGKYLIKTKYNGQGNEAVLNIQHSVLKSVFIPILTMFAIWGGSFIIGVGIILFSVLKYKKKHI